MASSSSSTSSIQKTFKYDVFLSFRGEDTRTNFVDHLYTALQQQGIHTFKDDERMKQGKRIDDQLISSIEDSKYFIIVFSQNYASSSWCLDELVQIMECHNTMQQRAYPVFYKVKPSDVRKQHGKFGKAFSKHKNEESVGKWRKALEEAANLVGRESEKVANGHEAKLIKKIVEEISLELRSINSGVDEKLVGMESRMKHVFSIVERSHDDVHMIGIKGMGGAGKTTLARAVFDKIFNRFDGYSFVENVREVSKTSLLGLQSLQQQVLSQVLKDKSIIIYSVSEGKKMIKSRLCGRKVVVVLDDVDDIEQLEALAGSPNWFKPGSLIIITTRDEQVLVAHRVKQICDVNLLSDDEASRLFNRYSFGREIPIEGYEDLSTEVIRYADGLPLTIKVLGSFLCGKDKLEWEDALERLKTIPLPETLKKLELSYIGLEKDYKEIFLDVACFLKGWQKERAIMLLESCGFNARIGLRVLEQKSLITTRKYGSNILEQKSLETINNDVFLGMHDHIEKMGRHIVRREHPHEPGKHTRLWIQPGIEDLLAKNLDTEATRCIKMDHNSKIVMEGLVNMKKLRCLIVETNYDVSEIRPYFPSELQYLSWWGYPNQSLPKNFGADNLVGLEMCHSDIDQLWERGKRKVLNKLKFIDLTSSRNLRTLDLGLTPNLEKLVLKICYDLVELQMPSPCLNLKSLVVTESKLETLNLGSIPNLEKLVIERCDEFVELQMPSAFSNLKSIIVTYSKLRTLDLGLTPNLEELNLNSCDYLVQLHMHVVCPRLAFVDLSHSKLKTVNLGLAPNLEKLVLERCDGLVELQMPSPCSNLKSLIVTYSKLRTLDLGLTPNLEKLVVKECHDLVKLHIPSSCLNLTSLELSCLGKLTTLDLRPTPNLEKLDLIHCVHLIELHMPVESIKLKSLVVSYLNLRTLDLGLTPNLEDLNISNCHDLVQLHMHVVCPRLESVDLCRSKLKTFDLGLSPNLKKLVVEECDDLVDFHSPLNRCTSIYFFHSQPLDRAQVEKSLLEEERRLAITGSNLEVLKIFGQLECLQDLFLSTVYTKHLPGISHLYMKQGHDFNLMTCTNNIAS